MATESPIEYAVKLILEEIGEDVDREGLQDTPARVARMYRELFCGLQEDPEVHLKKQFTGSANDLIVVKDIPFTSTCEHHLVPFVGYVHVGYIPSEVLDGDKWKPGDGKQYRITGLSKLARVVDGYAKRPQIQEQLTGQIADAIVRGLDPVGCIVVVKAEHMCMTIRGVHKPGTQTVTSAVRGIFYSNKDGVKDEFFKLLEV